MIENKSMYTVIMIEMIDTILPSKENYQLKLTPEIDEEAYSFLYYFCLRKKEIEEQEFISDFSCFMIS